MTAHNAITNKKIFLLVSVRFLVLKTKRKLGTNGRFIHLFPFHTVPKSLSGESFIFFSKKLIIEIIKERKDKNDNYVNE